MNILINIGPKYTIPGAARLNDTTKFGSFAHSYHTPEDYNKSSYVFGKDTRFKYEKELEIMKSKGPGPGAYTKTSSFQISNPKKFGFGSSKKISDVVYEKELQNCYISKHSPGPGTYNSKHFFSERILGGKINPPSTSPEKTMTRFKPPTMRDQIILEDHNQFIQLKKKMGEIKIGTEKRRYDPIFFAAQNKEFIIKGLK